jgi:hypothetical protein
LRLACSSDCRHLPDREDLFKAVVLPDDDLAHLIEAAFLEGQIDGETQSLAFAWLERNHQALH